MLNRLRRLSTRIITRRPGSRGLLVRASAWAWSGTVSAAV